MVWQYLHGRRPLNVAVATKFAKGLRVAIDDFSPRLGNAVRAAANTLDHSHNHYVASDVNGEYVVRSENPKKELNIKRIVRYGSEEERSRAREILAAMLFRARPFMSPQEFNDELDALEQLDGTDN
jgi:hypothetical protein